MFRGWRSISALLLLVMVAACRDGGLAPLATGRGPALLADALGASPCPAAAAAAVTVTDDAGLRAALRAATPGEVIAVSGMIGVTVDDTIATAGVELTCATRGSGLFAASSAVFDMVTVLAKDVTVDHLVLDGSAASDSPYLALNDGVTGFATDPRFTHNVVTCVPNLCAFFVGTPRSLVADNRFMAPNPFSGVHFQAADVTTTPPVNPPDDSKIERNTLIATSPSQPSPFGAIRVTTASRVEIDHNVALGPWANDAVLTQLDASSVTQNDFENALAYGVRLSRGFNRLFVTNTAFTNNSVSGAPSGGIFAFEACTNSFLTNTLEGNGGDVGLVFPQRSGGNVVVGVDNATVIDNGAFDCDADGDIDPNVIKGQGASHQALPPDDATYPARTAGGITLQ